MVIENHVSAGARLQIALETAGLSQSDFARTLGCDRSSISKAVLGRQRPTPEMLEVLARDHGLSASWILSGIGPMRLPAETGNPAIQAMTKEARVIHRLVDDVLASGNQKAVDRLHGFLEGLMDAIDAKRSA